VVQSDSAPPPCRPGKPSELTSSVRNFNLILDLKNCKAERQLVWLRLCETAARNGAKRLSVQWHWRNVSWAKQEVTGSSQYHAVVFEKVPGLAKSFKEHSGLSSMQKKDVTQTLRHQRNRRIDNFKLRSRTAKQPCSARESSCTSIIISHFHPPARDTSRKGSQKTLLKPWPWKGI